MVAPAAPADMDWTLDDVRDRFGSIFVGRIVTDPAPGTATRSDFERVNGPGSEGGVELIDGILIRKAMSEYTGWLGGYILRILGNFIESRGLGWVQPGDNRFHFPDGMLGPDVTFTRRDQRPDGLQTRGWSDVPPALVVEVISPGNTPREMHRKREIYFAAGVEEVWEVWPEPREVRVFTAVETQRVLRPGDRLESPVLPGFATDAAELLKQP
jgi:Uma2 family endonuclease